MVAGLLHVLVFFVVPYSTLSGMLGGLGQLAGALGVGDVYPQKLTGLAVVKMSSLLNELSSGSGTIIIIPFLLPVILGLILILLNAIGKGRVSYVFSIIISIFTVAGYALIFASITLFLAVAGYIPGVTSIILAVLSFVQMIIAIVGCVKDKSGASAKGGKDKNVKVGKKDGSITGVSGSYIGAVIPVKSGANIIIGRDPAVSSIVVKDEKASRKHCEIAFNAENGMYAVTDYSVNGTFDRDGNRLPEKVAVPMSAGSEIRIGKDGDIFRLG